MRQSSEENVWPSQGQPGCSWVNGNPKYCGVTSECQGAAAPEFCSGSGGFCSGDGDCCGGSICKGNGRCS